MKVRVNYTVNVSDDYRRAINLHYGRPGLATRDEVRRWLEDHGSAEDDNLMWDLQENEKGGENDG
jgi:hypothetical protein